MKHRTIPSLGLALGIVVLAPSGRGQEGTFKPDKLPESWPKDAAPDKAAKAPAESTDLERLKKLLGTEGVTMIRAARVFLPGKGGKAPRLVDGGGKWLATKDGEILGLFTEPQERVELPADQVKARMLDFTKDHANSLVMPGLVDADSRWARSEQDLNDAGADASVSAADDVDTWQRGWQQVVRDGGVTTVFVPSSLGAQASGPGVLLALDPETGIRVASKNGALYFRLANLATRGSSLTRIGVGKALQSALEAAKKYREAQDKWKKDLDEYEKKRKEFLAYYKKNPLKPGQEIEREAPRRGSRGRRGRMPQTKEELEKMLERFPPALRERMRKQLEARMKAAQEAAAKAKAAEKKAEEPKKTNEKKAPPRPTYPKKPAKDRAKEELLRVLDGKRALRVEAHRAAEIRALLDVIEEFKLKNVALVGGTEAYRVAGELRRNDVTVVLAPHELPDRGLATLADHWASSAAKLAAEGVRVAFGSAGTYRSRWLSMLAARAVALGMPPEQALQGLTSNGLHAAGTEGAESGVVVFSDSPFAPSARVVCLSRGRGLWEPGGEK